MVSTNNAISFNQLKKSVFNMKNYIDKSLPDAERFINERIVEVECNTVNPEIHKTYPSGAEQYIYNFDITGKHSDNMGVSVELIMNNTNYNYSTQYTSIINGYESQTKYKLLSSLVKIIDNNTNKEIGFLNLGLGAKETLDESGNIKTTSNLHDSAYIELSRRAAQITNDTNNLFANGFKVKIKFYDISAKYAGDLYDIPYNLSNGEKSGSIQNYRSTSNGLFSQAIGYSNIVNADYSTAIGVGNKINTYNSMAYGYDNNLTGGNVIAIGSDNNIGNFHSIAIGKDLTISGLNRVTAGSMILGKGGTLPKDSLFTISTSINDENNGGLTLFDTVRYPFDAKSNGDTYIRGKNVFLETETEITNEKSIVNKKYVDGKVLDSDKYIPYKTYNLDIDLNNPSYKKEYDSFTSYYFNLSNIINIELGSIIYPKADISIKNTNYHEYDNLIKQAITVNSDKFTQLFAGGIKLYASDIVKEFTCTVCINGKYNSETSKYDYSKNDIVVLVTIDKEKYNSIAYTNGILVKVDFCSQSNNYAGDIYKIPYNLKNGYAPYSLKTAKSYISEGAYYSIALGDLNIIGKNALYSTALGTSNIIDNGTKYASILGYRNTVNLNNGIAIGNLNTVNNFNSIAIGNGLTIDGYNRETAGNIIIGKGGTLAKDSLFAISTALSNKNDAGSVLSDTVRYPFEVKKDNNVYLRGSNLILETDNEPSQDNHLITKKYVDNKVAGIVNSAPETLDTLQELATALGNDPNFATTVATQIGKKVDKVDGMSLTHNDLTNELKANYDAAYTYSQTKLSYNDLNDLPTIPSIDGLATEEYVKKAIAGNSDVATDDEVKTAINAILGGDYIE